MHVVLAGGGTAGHIEPALALADALRRQDPTVGITALGTEKGLETRLVPERGYELGLIPAVPLPRKPTPELITVPGRLRDLGTARLIECADAETARLLVGDRQLGRVCDLAGERRLVFRGEDEAAVRARLRKLGYVVPPAV